MGFYDCARFQRTCNSAERLDERALMDDLLHSSRMYIVALKKKIQRLKLGCTKLKRINKNFLFPFFVEIISICSALDLITKR